MIIKVKDLMNTDIETIDGHTNIILVAPHGHSEDEENTGKLVRLTARQSGCYAIINEIYQRPDKNKTADKTDYKLDLNHIDQVKTYLKKEFLACLLEYKNQIKNEFETVLIFWIHGPEDKNLIKDSRSQSLMTPSEIKLLIGYGQDAEQPRPTASDETAMELYQALNNNNLPAVPADASIRMENEKKAEKDREKNYCGWDKFDMNQLFAQKNYDGGDTDYMDEYVQSFQLGIRTKGCMDSNGTLEATSQGLAGALAVFAKKKIMPGAPGSLVEKAYSTLFDLFSTHYENAMMDAGKYLIKTFYGDDIEKARNNESAQEETLNQLYEKIDKNKNANSPSRSKLYHAKNLVVQEYDLENFLSPRAFSTLRNLSLSHKIYLLSVKGLNQKKYWIDKIFSEKLTIQQLQAQKNSAQPREPTPGYLINHPEKIGENKHIVSVEGLKEHPPAKLKKFKKRLEQKKNDVEKQIRRLADSMNTYEQFLKEFSSISINLEEAIQDKEKNP